MHTCDHCNCPKCLVQRAGKDNPVVQAALQEAWAPDVSAAWGIPSSVDDRHYLAEYEDERAPEPFYSGSVDMRRVYTDPANPLNNGVDRYPRQAKAPILGLIPRRKPANGLEWFIVGAVATIAMSIVGTVIWVIYQIKLAFENTGAYLAEHGTQIITGLVVIVAIWALVALCTGGGGGRGFSGTFSGRMH